jgi:ubiquinone/menaquinone biosynthesis C-methylase UbiE
MNWHSRYLQQAAWTRDLRTYLFEQAGLKTAHRVLEVGCGTGAILRELSAPTLHGLDLEAGSLAECRIHAPAASLSLGNGHALPYPDNSFDIVYCHYLLLWVADPLQVLCEMARVGHAVLALAEPDYNQRVDQPSALEPLGRWQTEALRKQGADPSFGSSLAETFYRAGIKLIETGPIQGGAVVKSAGDWEKEWEVIESDLDGLVPESEIQKMKKLDEAARRNGQRTLNVPTFFAWGKT